MRRTLPLLAAAFALASPVLRADSMFRGDASHTGVYASQGPREFHRVKWSFLTGDAVVGSAIVDRGTVYFGSNDGQVYALDAATGRRRWSTPTGGAVPSTPALAGGVLYFASYDGKFYAVDAATGAVRWKFATEGERRFEAKGLHGFQPRTQTIADPFDAYLSSPVVLDGSVYFGSGDGHVYALDARSGELRWKFKTGDVVHASPALVDGLVVVGSWDGNLYALDAHTGAERWRFKAGVDDFIHNQQGFQASPAVAGGVIYVGCRDAHVYALKASSGEKLWEFFTNLSWVNTTPAVRDGKVYAATSDSGLIHALDAATGKELYQQKASSYVWSSPALAGDVFFIGQFNGSLDARDVGTGALLWRFQTEAAKRNAGWVLAADGSLNGALVSHSNWQDYAYDGLYRIYSVGAFVASPTVADGVVYVGSTDGRMYALE